MFDYVTQQDHRLMLEAAEFNRRLGFHEPGDLTSWTAPFRVTVAFEQARNERSQHEWYCKSEILTNTKEA